MFWLFQLVTAHPDDFWLNVVAGLPFLAADILLITLLLPWVIEKWTDRRWRETRRLAIRRVVVVYLETYRLGLALEKTAVMAVADFCDRSVRNSGLIADRLRTASRDAHRLIARADSTLQTLMPILNADQVKTLLDFHMDWSEEVAAFAHMADRLAEGVIDPAVLIAEIEDRQLQGLRLRLRHEALADRLIGRAPAGADEDEATGPMWSPLTQDVHAQAWELVICAIHGDVMDLRRRSRLARALSRQSRMNEVRRQTGGAVVEVEPELIADDEMPRPIPRDVEDHIWRESRPPRR